MHMRKLLGSLDGVLHPLSQGVWVPHMGLWSTPESHSLWKEGRLARVFNNVSHTWVPHWDPPLVRAWEGGRSPSSASKNFSCIWMSLSNFSKFLELSLLLPYKLLGHVFCTSTYHPTLVGCVRSFIPHERWPQMGQLIRRLWSCYNSLVGTMLIRWN